MGERTKLTKKEKAFCEYYVFDNEPATQAYHKAYGGEFSTADKCAWKVLRRPHIKEYITALQKEAFAAACITAERVGTKLAEIAFAAKDDACYTPNQQLKALDLLQKQMGLQHQKIEAEVNTDINITIEE
jgi:phage terminase small subunit